MVLRFICVAGPICCWLLWTHRNFFSPFCYRQTFQLLSIFLAMVNKAAMNSFEFIISRTYFSFPFIKYLGELTNHQIDMYLISSETAKQFSKVTVPFAQPPAMYGSSCITSSPVLSILSLSFVSHSRRCEMVSQCEFTLHYFPVD